MLEITRWRMRDDHAEEEEALCEHYPQHPGGELDQERLRHPLQQPRDAGLACHQHIRSHRPCQQQADHQIAPWHPEPRVPETPEEAGLQRDELDDSRLADMD